MPCLGKMSLGACMTVVILPAHRPHSPLVSRSCHSLIYARFGSRIRLFPRVCWTFKTYRSTIRTRRRAIKGSILRLGSGLSRPSQKHRLQHQTIAGKGKINHSTRIYGARTTCLASFFIISHLRCSVPRRQFLFGKTHSIAAPDLFATCNRVAV